MQLAKSDQTVQMRRRSESAGHTSLFVDFVMHWRTKSKMSAEVQMSQHTKKGPYGVRVCSSFNAHAQSLI